MGDCLLAIDMSVSASSLGLTGSSRDCSFGSLVAICDDSVKIGFLGLCKWKVVIDGYTNTRWIKNVQYFVDSDVIFNEYTCAPKQINHNY